MYIVITSARHQRTKHIEIDIHFAREKVAVGEVKVMFMPSSLQFADVFTKGFPASLFIEFITILTVR